MVDQVGALSGNEAQVDDALEELHTEDGTQLFVVFVNSFDGPASGDSWTAVDRGAVAAPAPPTR